MVDVPAVFNRNDFVSILLPGYVNVIVAVIFFRPGLLTFKDFSLDLFSTVFLLIAGPSVGITLRELYRMTWFSYDWIMSQRSRVGKSKDNTGGQDESPIVNSQISNRQGIQAWSNEYARVRLTARPEEIVELDAAEADLDFNATTAIGLIFQAIATPFASIPLAIMIGLFLGSLVLLVAGYVEWSTSFSPTYNEISLRHAK